jgi:hypothetical protein
MKALRKTVRFAKAGFFGISDKLYHLSEEVLAKTIKNAVIEAVLAICFFLSLSSPSTRPMKIGVLAIGFIIAKKAINTVRP